MANQKATTAIFIDKYHPNAKGICAVTIKVTFERKKRYYQTGISLSPEDFETTMGKRPRDHYKETALKLQALEKRASDIIKTMPFFTWALFEKQYLTNQAAKDSLDFAFEDYARRLRKDERIGTAVSYECSKNSLSKFASGTRLADVTPKFLADYEKWMLKEGNSITTVGIYLRCLRTLFNEAIVDGQLSKEYYPFGKKKYEIPTSVNIKKSLRLQDISKIYYYEAEPGSTSEMAKDYWLFMYLCNGINVKDMCLLKHENIKGDILEFQRAKTVRTKRKVEPIRVILNEDLKAIIKRWGNIAIDGGAYIFPVIREALTPVRVRQLIQQVTKLINNHMKAIAGDLGIDGDVTTYAARHSFATVLQRSGASISFIGEALGHSNIKTTQNYLAGFEDEAKKETVKALTAFKAVI